MSIIHVTGTGGRVRSDRTSFIGHELPREVKLMVKTLPKIDKNTFRKLLQVLVSAAEGEKINSDDFFALCSDALSEEMLAAVFSGLHRLLRSAFRVPVESWKPEVFKEDLNEMQFPEDKIEDLVSCVFGARRGVIDEHQHQDRPQMPKLDQLKWRVDVAISTSALNRVLEPIVLMDMRLKDGTTQQFEVPISKFHQLRYNVSLMLKEVEDLEQRGILKVHS